ncbi:MAG: urea transporter [Elusimicrobia bacterium]|nr:urea transporter [Elusimicrobiota bacterium]
MWTRHGRSLAGAYSAVFFLDSPWAGAVMAAATFLYPNIGAAGLLGLLSGFVVLQLLGSQPALAYRGFVLYNSLLIGLFTGYLFQLDGGVALLICLAASLTLLLTLFLEAVLRGLGLPVLSVPFTLVAMLLALAAHRFSSLTDATWYFTEKAPAVFTVLPAFATHFLRSLGACLCLPDPLFGAILLGAIACRSPLMAVFAIAGFSLGCLAESLPQLAPLNTKDPHFFNYSLMFPAIAAVFLVPSASSVGLAVAGTLMGSLVTAGSLAFWDAFRIPITALPFNVMVLLVVRAVLSAHPARLATEYAGAPEETIDRLRLNRLRHGTGEVGVFCPFEGTWAVQQGFDGPLTHRGQWRHALDFVVLGDDGKTFQGEGNELSDHHAFGRPVLSPFDGYMAAVCSNLPDNPVGRVEIQKNWGNHVVVRSLSGVFAIVAHLRKDSATVGVGDYVLAGRKLGECGNSGYSQEPHIHLQVQASPEPGAPSLPFHLVNFVRDGVARFQGVPEAGTRLSPLPVNRELERGLSLRIGEPLEFSRADGPGFSAMPRIDELRGTTFLLADGGARLYYGKVGAQLFFYGFEGPLDSPLTDLYACLPRVPLAHTGRLRFEDHLPLAVTDRLLPRWAKLAAVLATGGRAAWPASYEMDCASLEIAGEASLAGRRVKTFARLDPVLGLFEFGVDARRYRRTLPRRP